MSDPGFRLELDTDAALAAIRGGSFEGLMNGAEHLAQVSSSRAPHQEGHLERSAEPSGDRARMTAAVSFDGPYAVVQHEDQTFRHDNGREAKYLEKSMHTERDVIAKLIERGAQRRTGG